VKNGIVKDEKQGASEQAPGSCIYPSSGCTRVVAKGNENVLTGSTDSQLKN
jgi:hypothetical protein